MGQNWTIFKIWLLFGPFFWIITWKDTFRCFLEMIVWFKCFLLPRKDPKTSHILNIVQFWPALVNSKGSFGHFLEIFSGITKSSRRAFWAQRFADGWGLCNNATDGITPREQSHGGKGGLAFKFEGPRFPPFRFKLWWLIPWRCCRVPTRRQNVALKMRDDRLLSHHCVQAHGAWI